MPEIDVGMTPEEHEEAAQIEPLPPDTYDVELETVETHTSQKGNLVFDLRWRVINHPEYNNRVLFDHPMWGGRQMQSMIEATGFTWQGRTLNTEDMIGLQCQVVVVVEDYTPEDGKTRKVNRIVDYVAK